MTGIPLIIAFFIMVVVMIVAISKFKIHPFLSIMGVSLILALLALPLAKVPGTIGAGFSGTFSSLGIVIILGAIIGVPRNWRICAKSPVHLAISTMDLTAIRIIGMTIGAKEIPAPGSWPNSAFSSS